MTGTELKEILRKHKMWLNNEDGGECANLRHANLSRADLSRADLSCADLSCAKLHCANLSGADLSCADLSRADLSCADLSCAKLHCANLSGADLSHANLRHANLRHANLSRADLRHANLSRADLSGATGLIQQWEFLKNNFYSTAEGVVAYKTFGDTYSPPAKWKLEKGSVITENVDFNRTNDCGCGINVATFEWVKEYCTREIWKVLIRWEWLAGVCVPYNSDGKIRCECVELIEIID